MYVQQRCWCLRDFYPHTLGFKTLLGVENWVSKGSTAAGASVFQKHSTG